MKIETIKLTKKNKRLLSVVFISIIGIILSYALLRPALNNEQKNSKLALAYLQSSSNEVKKQSNGKITWSPIQKGDLLYQGDKVKTSKDSTAQIMFNDGKTKIDVDSDSVIVIGKNDDKLALKVVKGNLFVNNSDKSNLINILTEVNGKEKQLTINENQAQVSVGKDGKTDIDSSKNKRSNINFLDMRPFFGENIYVESANQNSINFSWQNTDDANYKIEFEIGKNRDELIRPQNAEIENFKDKKISSINVKNLSGTHYWRIKAIGPKNEISFSPTFRFNAVSVIPPILTFPQSNENVRIRADGTEKKFEFRWNLPTTLENIEIIVASDKDLKEVLVKEKVTHQTYYSTTAINRPGNYFWKILGEIEIKDPTGDKRKKIESKINNFNYAISNELFSPELLAPNDKEKYFQNNQQTNRTIFFSWKPEGDAKEYLLTIKGKSLKKEFRTNATEFQIANLDPGNYQWNVQSIDDENHQSKIKETRTFAITQMGTLNIKLFHAQNTPDGLKEKYSYVENHPKININWYLYKDAKSYRIRMSNNQFMQTAETAISNTTSHQFQTNIDGKYFVQVEALNEFDQVMAKTSIEHFSIEKSPVPEAPEFSFNTPNILTASDDGRIEFQFKETPKNHTIILEIRDVKESVIISKTLTDIKVMLDDLMPGRYGIYARYQDSFNRLGLWSTKKILEVKETSGIAPPVIRGINIK